MSTHPPVRVIVVVPTRNRLEMLRKCIEAVDGQARRPAHLVIVDNASNDGTREWLTKPGGSRNDVTVVTLEQNLGGAGGYHSGIRKAWELGADWIWTLDDDSVPEPCALAALMNAATIAPEAGFLASRVLWKDGSPHVMNVPGFAGGEGPRTGLKPITRASFVSILISRRAVRDAGLPIKEFFIHSDDVEYTTRITSHGFAAFLVKESRVFHMTASNTGVTLKNLNVQPATLASWKYTVRNLVAVNRRRPFGWVRESVRLCLLFARLLASPTPREMRKEVLKAGIEGLFMDYEKWIEYPGTEKGDMIS